MAENENVKTKTTDNAAMHNSILFSITVQRQSGSYVRVKAS